MKKMPALLAWAIRKISICVALLNVNKQSKVGVFVAQNQLGGMKMPTLFE
jgi:hypothetical protein